MQGNNQTSFPLLSVSSITQVTLLHQNLPERPVPPSAANVDLAPSQSALRFVMSAAFELSASNTIDASDVGRFVDEYLQQVADAVGKSNVCYSHGSGSLGCKSGALPTGVSRHQVIVGLKQINYANVTSIINSQLLFKEVVRSIATDIYLVFSDLSAAMLWLEEIPTLGQVEPPSALCLKNYHDAQRIPSPSLQRHMSVRNGESIM